MRRCEGVIESGRRCSVVPIPGHVFCKSCEDKEARGEMPKLAVVKLPVEPLRAHNLKPAKKAKTVTSDNKLPDLPICVDCSSVDDCVINGENGRLVCDQTPVGHPANPVKAFSEIADTQGALAEQSTIEPMHYAIENHNRRQPWEENGTTKCPALSAEAKTLNAPKRQSEGLGHMDMAD